MSNKLRGIVCSILLPAAIWILVGGCAFNPCKVDEGICRTNDNRIVARTDFDISPDWTLPVFTGRDFWNLMSVKIWTNWANEYKMAKYISSEPMVFESAVRYGASLSTTNNPLVVDMTNLKLKGSCIKPETNVPFMLSAGGRPPLAYMLPFRPNYSTYKHWKEQYPNFVGFMAGDEFDSDFVGALAKSKKAGLDFEGYQGADWLRNDLRRKGFAEKDIEACVQSASQVIEASQKGRWEAVAGLKKCHDAWRGYFFNDCDKLLFLHSAWTWDHYPMEWGAGGITLETSGTGSYRHQLGMFFSRGAARQYHKFWSWYIAVCYNGFTEDGKWDDNAFPYCLTTNESPIAASGHVRGPTCGMSVSLNRRDMYLAYLSGASFVENETWPYAYCQFVKGSKEKHAEEWELSPYGAAIKDSYAFARRHPARGVAYTPVALMIPFNQGAPQWGGRPWSYFPMERPDSMIDAFTYTLVPLMQYLKQGQEGCLANSPYGDIYDVILPNPPSGPVALKTLMNYKVAVMLGGFDIDKALARRLREYVKKGGTLVINIRQVNANLPAEFIGAQRSGKVCGTEGEIRTADGKSSVTLTEPYDYEQVDLRGAQPLWLDGQGGVLASVNDYGRGRVVLTTADYMVPRKSICDNNDDTFIRAMKARNLPLIQLLMRQIVREALPVEVVGEIEYGVNRVEGGWWVYLINNKGVTKFTRTAEKLDPAASAQVTIRLRDLAAKQVRELREEQDVSWDRVGKSLSLTVGPGDIKVVEIKE